MAMEKVTLPDFGGIDEIIVVEVYVSPGDHIEQEGSLIALESDKAVMDLPSPFTGTVKEVSVKENDRVKKGDLIVTVEVAEEAQPDKEAEKADEAEKTEEAKKEEKPPKRKNKRRIGKAQAGPKSRNRKCRRKKNPSLRSTARNPGRYIMRPLRCGPMLASLVWICPASRAADRRAAYSRRMSRRW